MIDQDTCCGVCRYGRRAIAMAGKYLCRRHAPIAVKDESKHAGEYQEAYPARWPVVDMRDWCGEFESIGPGHPA